MFGNPWHKKEKPLPTLIGMGGGATGWMSSSGGPGVQATGGIISDYTDGADTYRAHVFLTPGTFVVSDLGGQGGTADILIVAGGGGAGGGGGGWPGGGGGGGVLEATEFALGTNTYPITIGAGGRGGQAWPTWQEYGAKVGQVGENTVFTDPSGPSTYTALGGGYGGGGSTAAGGPGGSGGGSQENTPGTPTSTQNPSGAFTGYGHPAGGAGPNRGAGGGGAGGAGGTAITAKYPGGTGGVAPNRSYWTNGTPLSYSPGAAMVVAGAGRANTWAEGPGHSIKYAGGGGGSYNSFNYGNSGLGNQFLTGLPNPFTGETITDVNTGPPDLSGGKGGDFFQGTNEFGTYGPTPDIDGNASYDPGVSRMGMTGLGGGGGGGNNMNPRNPESPQPQYPNPITPYPAQWGGSVFDGITPAPDSWGWTQQRGGNGGSGTVVIRYKILPQETSTSSAKATGGKISYYNSKVIHTFFHPGKFVAPASISNAEIVVIGGGGGGGSRHGGGGGAGSCRFQTSQTIPAATHIVKVGQGGASCGPVSPPYDGRQQGNPGQASVWAAQPSAPWEITAPGGGGGAGGSGPNQDGDASPGGSGGGASAGGTAGGSGPSGNPGGTSSGGSPYTGGGGGGSGGAGAPSPASTGGNGGSGSQLPATFRDPRSSLGVPGSSGGFWVGGGGGGGVNNTASPGVGGGGGGGPAAVGTGPYAGGGPGGGVSPTGVAANGAAGIQGTGGGGGGGGCNNPNPATGGQFVGLGGSGGPGLVLVAYPV